MRLILPALAVMVGGLRLSAAPLPLADDSPMPVVVLSSASPVERFAADELARYLGRMTGRAFAVQSVAGEPPARAFLVGQVFAGGFGVTLDSTQLGEDGVRLKRSGERILIAGAGDRGTLYAAYAFLERLGCRWFAPNFSFYGAAGGESVPHLAHVAVDELDVTEKPAFSRRKKYIEEGQSHDVPSLLALIDWMAKVRLNVLDCPINYQGEGRTKWDNWREALIPELSKRGLLIEVGGHGYQNFLPASRYFGEHPDWFGMQNGRRSEAANVVFATANPAAVATFIANVREYLRQHPEIDIFDCWPPDMARWSEAPEDVALGSPSERQMLLLNQVVTELNKEFPRLQVQFLAYASYVEPPPSARPSGNVVMEFCPIDRAFQVPLYDASSSQNAAYYRQLKGWLDGAIAPGAVAIYTYVGKYRWYSLPILVPRLIAAEAGHFAALGLGGFSSYSEPGSWAALDLDHYFLARYSWDAHRDVERELQDYATNRYGPAAGPVLEYLRLVEEVVPNAVAIAGSNLQVATQKKYLADFEQAGPLLEKARQAAAGNPATLFLIGKLDGARRYALNEIQLRLAFLEAGVASQRGQLRHVEELITERRKIVAENHGQGLMLGDGKSQ